MQQNFEQSKSVTYWVLGSRFVIPWTVKDPFTLHAEIETVDGRKELIPERDFKVDVYESSVILKVRNPVSNTDLLRIFEGDKQEVKAFREEPQKAPHHLVREADLHPVKSRLEEVATAVKKVDKIDDIATGLEAVRKKAEQVDSLVQTTNTIGQKVDTLADRTEDFFKKIEQIDLSKIEGLDPQTRQFLQKVQNQLNEAQITLQEVDGCGRPSISMRDKAGQLIAQIYHNSNGNLVIGQVNDKNYFTSHIAFYPDKDIYANGEKLINGSSPSIFDEIAKRLTPHFLGLLQDRTTIRCAYITNHVPKLNSVISGTDIAFWSYPTHDGLGDLYNSPAYAWNTNLSDEQKKKKWKIVGRTVNMKYYAHSLWHWVQEVIEPTDIVFKTVGNSTLADNLIDIKTMQNKIKLLDSDITADKTKISQLENDITSAKTGVSELAVLKQKLEAMEKRIKELEATKEKSK